MAAGSYAVSTIMRRVAERIDGATPDQESVILDTLESLLDFLDHRDDL